MTVSELKQIVPLDDVYEIKADMRYIVKLPKGADRAAAQIAADGLRDHLDCIVVTGNVEFYEVK